MYDSHYFCQYYSSSIYTELKKKKTTDDMNMLKTRTCSKKVSLEFL